MGKKLILSEDERLNIMGLYKDLINEQRIPGLTSTSTLCDVVCGKVAARRGTKGDVVKTLQEALIKCGYDLPQYGADGNFGEETRQATLKYQKDKNLRLKDGAIGPETSGQLIKDGCLDDPECKCKGTRKIDGDSLIDRNLNVPCENVSKCVSEFMSSYEQDSCIDSDLMRNFMECLGLGDCFNGGVVPVKGGDCGDCPEWYDNMPKRGEPTRVPENIKACVEKGCTKYAS